MAFLDYNGLTRFKGKLDVILNNLSERITTLDTNVKSDSQAKDEYHLKFYRDADGDLCED